MQLSSKLPTSRATKNNTSLSDCPDSYSKWYCLNGATCFSVKIRDATLYNCWCPLGFHGLRCDYKYIERKPHNELSFNTSEEYNQVAVTLTLGETKGDTKNRPEAVVGRLQDKEIHLLVYNLLMIVLLMVLIVLIWRFVRRKLGSDSTMEQNESANEVVRSGREGNKLIDRDIVPIGMNCIRQQHYLHHARDTRLVFSSETSNT